MGEQQRRSTRGADTEATSRVKRTTTATSNFGASKRESHDATAFYDRFRPPAISADDTVVPPTPIDTPFVCGDARAMSTVADGTVALVVTSPPYFAGKQYEEELDRDGIPSSYLEFLDLLRDVFAECVRVLEPGGRIAVNVANLGRKPYRSLSADVIRILTDDLGLLLRGEIVWQKSEGASGSCAWGSFRSASNPVLRDLTERVIVASKGRFDRALTVKQRAAKGLPHRNTQPTDEFMAATLDVWSIPPESAKRVGHPAPFPVDLPARLIRLFTFEDDLVLDPFMGSGSSMVAAATLGRRYVGYDLDPEYVALAQSRVADALATSVAHPDDVSEIDREIAAAKLAEAAVADAGFTVTATGRRVAKAGTSIDISATDADGSPWTFLVAGPNLPSRGGMARTDVVWRTIGNAAALRGIDDSTPVVVLTTELPKARSEGDVALRAVGPNSLFDIIDVRDHEALERLRRYAKGGAVGPDPGFWT